MPRRRSRRSSTPRRSRRRSHSRRRSRSYYRRSTRRRRSRSPRHYSRRRRGGGSCEHLKGKDRVDCDREQKVQEDMAKDCIFRAKQIGVDTKKYESGNYPPEKVCRDLMKEMFGY